MDDPVDGRWTGCGRAGAAEIAWEEARDGGARSKVRIRWTGCGRAGGAEIAREEGSRRGKPVKKRDSTFEVFWLWEWDVVAGVLL